jgi:hypothetical protein
MKKLLPILMICAMSSLMASEEESEWKKIQRAKEEESQRIHNSIDEYFAIREHLTQHSAPNLIHTLQKSQSEESDSSAYLKNFNKAVDDKNPEEITKQAINIYEFITKRKHLGNFIKSMQMEGELDKVIWYNHSTLNLPIRGREINRFISKLHGIADAKVKKQKQLEKE